MPTKTRMLHYGGFVQSPDVPTSAAFAEYLREIDPLLADWRDAVERWSQSLVSAELLEHRKIAQRNLDDFAAAYQDRYTVKHVERNPAFLPVARFFARYRPIRRPFSILYCNLDLPLHTVYAFESADDLANVNAALDEVTPLRWWQDGPLNHPCYLFGEGIWELKPTEIDASDKGLTLLFEKTTEEGRLHRDRLQHDLFSGSNGPSSEQFIPEAVRTAVWRRDGGKCARCRSHEGVDFSIVAASPHGNTPTAQNVQLICTRCRER
jgi:hypothetical protein